MNYSEHLYVIKDKVNEFEERISSTPSLLIKVNPEEYEKDEKTKKTLSGQITFIAPFCKDPAFFYTDDWEQKISDALPEGFAVRVIENKNNIYPEDSVVGEIYTTKDLGVIPEDTVIFIFTAFGPIYFQENRSFFISYDNGECSFRLDFYENLLSVHEQCFVKKLLYCPDKGERAKLKLAESYIKNNTKKKDISRWNDYIFTYYFDSRGKAFARCYNREWKNNPFEHNEEYKIDKYPSLSKLSEFISKSKSDAIAFAMIERYMQEISKKYSVHEHFTHLKYLPDNLTFTQSAICLNNEVLVDCQKPIPEIIDDIFKACKSSDLQLGIKAFTVFEKTTYSELYKEIVAYYTKLSIDSKDLVSRYNKAFCGSVKKQKQFFQSEFLKQAIFNVFVKDSSMLYNNGTKSSNVAAVIDLVNNSQIDILYYFNDKQIVDLSVTIEDKTFVVGYLLPHSSTFHLSFYPYVIDVMADFLFTNISLEELVQEYLSLDVKFYNTNRWAYHTDYLNTLLENKTAITESIFEPFNDKCSLIKAPDSDKILNRISLEQEAEMLGNILINFGKAKNEYGGNIAISKAYCHEGLKSWFKYISVTIEKEIDKYVYTGFCPAKMRRYLYIKQHLDKQAAST